jgi:hypothetical protein
MKKEISPLIVVVAVLVVIVGGWFIFQRATGPIRSETASPDVTKMTSDEIAKIKQNSNPDSLR